MWIVDQFQKRGTPLFEGNIDSFGTRKRGRQKEKIKSYKLPLLTEKMFDARGAIRTHELLQD